MSDMPCQADMPFTDMLAPVAACSDSLHSLSASTEHGTNAKQAGSTPALCATLLAKTVYSPEPWLCIQACARRPVTASVKLMGVSAGALIQLMAMQVELRSRALLASGAQDIVVPVYDEEPTSIITYALASRSA